MKRRRVAHTPFPVIWLAIRWKLKSGVSGLGRIGADERGSPGLFPRSLLLSNSAGRQRFGSFSLPLKTITPRNCLSRAFKPARDLAGYVTCMKGCEIPTTKITMPRPELGLESATSNLTRCVILVLRRGFVHDRCAPNPRKGGRPQVAQTSIRRCWPYRW